MPKLFESDVPQARTLLHRAILALAMFALGLTPSLSVAVEASRAGGRTLTFDQRVAAQKAIEQVYWNHRMWPKANPGPKPPLSAVMSDDAIRAKVEDYLKKSNALERWWQRPITSEQLQAEMDRIAKSTRDGATLNELYRALGNDAFVIAETLARQTLAERLIRNWYASDNRFHDELMAKAEAARVACSRADCMKSMSGEYHETTWQRRDIEVGRAAKEKASTVLLQADDWAEHLRRLATKFSANEESVPTGRLSRIEETPDAFVVTAVLAQRASEITIASVTWPKRSFDAWWNVERGAVESAIEQVTGSFTLFERTIDHLHE